MKIRENYPPEIDAVLELALREDIGDGDVTTESIIDKDAVLTGERDRRDFRAWSLRRGFS